MSDAAATPSPAPPARWKLVLQGVVLALLTTGCFLPTEGASQGDMLWLAILWMAAATLAAFVPTPSVRVWTLLDAGAALFIGGHLVSGLLVLGSGPDRYTASILLVEWLGLAAAWFSLRSAFADTGLPDQVLSLGLLIAATLSVYGLWQSFVWYPSMAAQYGPKMELVRQLGTDNPAAAEAVRELQAAGVPTEGSALILFEKRLRDSREPFGLFALANTFGGFLAVWLLLGIGLWRKIWGSSWRRQGLILGLLALIAYCLYLTNSRTAWGGLLFGLAGLFAGNFRSTTRGIWIPRIWLLGTGLAAAGIVLYGIVGDWENRALPGPLKSLTYRFQYWRGTWKFLQEHWLSGIGLGQFRGAYTAHKLPEASEDVADPHNLFLDSWSNGGLLAVFGLVLLLYGVVRPVWRRGEPLSAGQSQSASFSWVPILVGAVAAGMMLAFLGPFLLEGEWNDAPLVLLFLFAALTWLASVSGAMPIGVGGSLRQQLCVAAAAALGMHLVGAGSIGLPAVAQSIFLLAIGALDSPAAGDSADRFPPKTIRVKRALSMSAGCFFVVAGLASTWLIVVPVHSARMLVDAGDRSVSRGLSEFAARAYQEAAEAAPWSPEPWLRISALEEQAWRASGRQDEERFRAAVAAMESAWQRNSASYLIAQQAARLWSERAAATATPDDRKQSIDWARRAVSLSPTNARLQADLALGLAAAGERAEAAEVAQKALQQQKVNDQQGHMDRLLPEPLVAELTELASWTGPRNLVE